MRQADQKRRMVRFQGRGSRVEERCVCGYCDDHGVDVMAERVEEGAEGF
jgi:hypothetical protein